MISNALKGQPTPKKKWKKTENYHSNGSKNSQNGKANDQLQSDQGRSKVTSEYCNN